MGLTTNAEDLQELINVVQEFCNKWRLKSDSKRVQLWYFLKRLLKIHVHGSGGDKEIPRVVIYCYWALNLLIPVMVYGIVMYRR